MALNKLTILGVVVVVLAAAGLLLGHFTYSETKPVLDVGPIHVSSQEEHEFTIPVLAGSV